MLHSWLTSEDLGVALYATKALANLDREAESYKYVDGVHLYHPQYRHQYVLQYSCWLILKKSAVRCIEIHISGQKVSIEVMDRFQNSFK